MKDRRAIRYLGGNQLAQTSKALTRHCPRCGAWPGKRCFRIVGRSTADDVPGHQEPLAKPHLERRRPPTVETDR